MKKSKFIDFVHNCIYTAGLVKLLYVCVSCWCKMTKVRCFCAYFSCNININFNSGLVSYCWKVKHTVC